MTWHELTRGIVMPAHCDVYGHMNVRHYAAFFDDAGWHMLAKAGVSLSELHAQGLGSVVATLTIDFHHELKAGQLTLVSGAFVRVGDKSFSYEIAALRKRVDDPLCDAEDGRSLLRHRGAPVGARFPSMSASFCSAQPRQHQAEG